MYHLGLVLNKVTKVNSHVCQLTRIPGPVCLQRREQKPNRGDNLSCRVCTEELVISLFFYSFLFLLLERSACFVCKRLCVQILKGCVTELPLHVLAKQSKNTCLSVPAAVQSPQVSHHFSTVSASLLSAARPFTFCLSKLFRIDSFSCIISGD